MVTFGACIVLHDSMVLRRVKVMKKRMRLRDLREDNDLTQQQVADLLGTTKQYQKYESGIRPIPVDRLETLADFYKTSTDYLLGRTRIKKPYPIE